MDLRHVVASVSLALHPTSFCFMFCSGNSIVNRFVSALFLFWHCCVLQRGDRSVSF
jgi:hypothetical protein